MKEPWVILEAAKFETVDSGPDYLFVRGILRERGRKIVEVDDAEDQRIKERTKLPKI